MDKRVIYFYLFRQHLKNALLVLFAFSLILLIGQFADMSRRLGDGGNWSMVDLFVIATFRVPILMQDVLPHIILVSAALTLYRLSRHLELVAILQSGLSPWQLLMPVSACGLVFGIAYVSVLNPLAVRAEAEADGLTLSINQGSRERNRSDETNELVTKDAEGTMIIVANGSSSDGTTLYDTSFFRFDNEHNLIYRADVSKAVWSPEGWTLPGDGSITEGGITRPLTESMIVASVSAEMLREKFGDEYSVSVFALPGKIQMATALGLSPHKFRVQFQWLAALPVLLAAVALLSSAIVMRPLLMHQWKSDVILTILASFFLYVVSTVLGVLGGRGLVSPAVAAWSVPFFVALAGVTVVLFKAEQS
ncbi:MAG: LptF/LptG family permease [Alphaproteobacteria bacterium]|nr:LptF/LptG family permease [Alphaproteobacteria bacterium]